MTCGCGGDEAFWRHGGVGAVLPSRSGGGGGVYFALRCRGVRVSMCCSMVVFF